MSICGLALRVEPTGATGLEQALAAFPGLEVAASDPATGRYALTLAEDDEAVAYDRISALARLPGVLSAAVTYHYRESPDEQEPSP